MPSLYVHKRRPHPTAAERERIMRAIRKHGLTGPEVEERFGFTERTIRNWKTRLRTEGTLVSHPRTGRPSNAERSLRAEIRVQVLRMLPALIEAELRLLLGGAAGIRRLQRARRG
jgi:transposase